MFHLSPLTRAVSAACVLMAANPALAQQHTPAPGEPLQLDRVTVTADALDRDDSRQSTVSTATKTNIDPRDVPQTVNTLEMSKSKVYGLNDLSVLLDGIPGVDTAYDTRGDGITLRGFSADSNDIYRDGIRNAGQFRRSTANVERIEILKGPASVLYGRGLGGGMVNLISKEASFDAFSSVSLRAGSWGNHGLTVDVNEILSDKLVVRLTADYEAAESFRRGIENRNRMISPSLRFDSGNGFSWLGQLTWDKIYRRPDRAPAFDALPAGVSARTAYAHPDDFIEDEMQAFRSVASYRFNPDWQLKWTAGWNRSSQNFDHLYAGSYCQPDGRLLSNNRACNTPGLMTFTRAWQETSNQTHSHTLDLTGHFATGAIKHDLLLGLEWSDERRNPDLATSAANSDPALRYPHGIDPYNPIWIYPKSATGEAKTSNRHRAQSQALYLQDLISLGEAWKVLAGLRFDRFEFSSHNRINDKQRSYSGSTVSPRLGVVWQPSLSQSLYAAYSKNFAPYGGRGLMSVAVDESAVFDEEPQFSRQYEVGVKSDWLENRFSTQFSLYQLSLYNIRYRPDPENEPFVWAVRGSERSRGAEFSIAGKLVDGVYLRGGIGLLNAQIAEDVTQPEKEGNYKPGIARKTGNLFLRYAPPGPWYGEIGVTYRGPIWNNDLNTSQRPGYTRWDASMGWRFLPWTVTVAVTNLTNTDYWRSSSMPGAPRSLLLSMNYVF